MGFENTTNIIILSFLIALELLNNSPDGRPHRAGELTDSTREVKGAVARDAGTHPSHLLLLARLVLNTPRHVCPCAVLLALRHVVPAPRADHSARVTHIGLGAVAGKSGACDQLPGLPMGIT